ncbi:MAG: hypothetical protein HY673_05685 [Chloroflexi bacterium]|nr:hypothetical protein [Chloroflexota bacterium]
MNELSTSRNELREPGFVSSSALDVAHSSAPLRFRLVSSPKIRYTVRRPRGTPRVVALPPDFVLGGWRSKSTILVQITYTQKETLATTWLEGIAEYGVAKGENEAVTDLVISLGEYRECLEKRETNLGDSARRELEHLRRLIERAPESSS